MKCSPLLKQALNEIDKSRSEKLNEVTDDFDTSRNIDTIIRDDNLHNPKEVYGRSDGIHQYRENREHPIKELYIDQNFGDNKIDRDIDYSKWYDKIEEYTKDEYELINKESRDSKPITDRSILNFLRDAPENFKGVVYRGSRANSTQLKEIEKLESGNILTNRSPLSTSIDFDTGRAFSTYNYDKGKLPVMLTIKGSGHDIAHASSNFDEAEVLLRPGKHYRLLDKVVTKTQVQLLLEEIPDEMIKLYSKHPKFSPTKGVLSVGGLMLLNKEKDNGNGGRQKIQ